MKIKVYGHNGNTSSSAINEVIHTIDELVVDTDYIQLGVIDGNHCVIVENIRMVIDRKEYDRVSKLLRVDMKDEVDTIEGDKEVENNVDDLEV